MDDSRTEVLPVTQEPTVPEASNPEDTSALPAVALPPSRLHRATNLLALGRVHEAAELCREELEVRPDSADAYALLAMAEEHAGNRHLAIELYEELLALDPTREAEAERLEELRREVEELEAQEPTEEEREEQLRRMQPVALVILIGAATLLLMSLVLLLVVRHRNAVVSERYGQAMQYGVSYYQQGYYAQSAGYFAQAVALRPKDEKARGWYEAAYRQAQATGLPANQIPQLYAPTQNPFAPIPVGPATAPAGVMPMPPPTTGPPVAGGSSGGADAGNPWDVTEPTPAVRGRATGELIKPPTPVAPPPAAAGARQQRRPSRCRQRPRRPRNRRRLSRWSGVGEYHHPPRPRAPCSTANRGTPPSTTATSPGRGRPTRRRLRPIRRT